MSDLMSMIYVDSVYFLFLLLLFSNVKAEWTDPTDMLNYDPITKTNKRFDLEVVPKCDCNSIMPMTESECCDDAREYKMKYKECQDWKEKNEINGIMKHSEVEMTYMKRFISNLLKQFDYEGAIEIQNYKVTIKLDTENRRKLEEFVNNKQIHLNEIDEILTDLIANSEPVDEEWSTIFLSGFDQQTKNMIQWILLSLVGCVILYMLLKIPLYYTFIILFFFGTFWHWQHMYQEAIAKRHADLTKNPDIPARCQPQRMNWYEGLSAWWSESILKGEDECRAYFKTLLVDPFWDISPTMAFSYMFTQFVSYPLGVLGTNIGAFFANLISALPPLATFIVLPFLLIVIGFTIFMTCGYTARGLGWSIGPSNNPQVMASQPRPMVEELHITLQSQERLQNQAIAVESSITPKTKVILDSSSSVNVKQHSGVEELESSESSVPFEDTVSAKLRRRISNEANVEDKQLEAPCELDEKKDCSR